MQIVPTEDRGREREETAKESHPELLSRFDAETDTDRIEQSACEYGAELIVNLALIYTWTGEKDRAFEQLKTTVRIPSNLSYGLLKLHPQWNPLRSDRPFDRLLARMATEPDQ